MVDIKLQKASSGYAAAKVLPGGELICPAGYPLRKIDHNTWRCDGGHHEYKLDEDTIRLDKFGNWVIKTNPGADAEIIGP